ASVPERLLQRFDETRALGGAQPQAVLDDGQDAVDERRGLELFERHGAGRPERPHEPRLQESRPHVGPRERRRRRQGEGEDGTRTVVRREQDRKSTRLNSSHDQISYAVFCLKKKKKKKKKTKKDKKT